MKKFYLIFLFCFLSFSSINAQQVEWINSVRYSAANRTADIGSDNKGNVYTAGTFQPGYHDIINPWGIFVSKYDSLGNLLWTDTSKASQRVKCNGIAVDDAGNCYITGMVINNVTITFGTTTISPPEGFESFFLVKYNPQGEVQWVNQTLNASGTGIVVLNNNIYITGAYSDPTNFGNYALPNNYGGFLLKCDTSGNYQWAKDMGGSEGLHLDGYDSGIYVQAANTNGWTTQIRKYNNAGNFIWAMDAPYGMNAMSADNDGNCYLTWGQGANDFIGKIDSTSGLLWQTNTHNFGTLGIYVDRRNSYLYSGETTMDTTTYVTIYDQNNGSFIKNIPIQKGTWYNGYKFATFSNSIYTGGEIGGQYPTAFVAKITDSSLNFASKTPPTSTDTVTTIPVVTVNTNTTSPTAIDTIPAIPVVQVTAIHTIETSLKEFNVFPNPANGIFQINYSSSASYRDDKHNLILNISNAEGQIMYTETISWFSGEFKKDIDLSQQAKGIYFVEIIANGKREVKRIVLE